MPAFIKEEILILVKTYPTISEKYYELVCTAGINRKGEWRRIYPIRFRALDEPEQYKKYQWVKVDLEENPSDRRQESYKLRPGSKIEILSDPLPATNCWRLRKEALKNTPVYNRLEEIIDKAKEKGGISLCQFKPKEILKLKIDNAEGEWSKKILGQMKDENTQRLLFANIRRGIKQLRKLPYKFSYQFKDDSGKESTLMIVDWEIGQLYWNCLKKARSNKEQACRKVKEKYEGFIHKNDVTLFLGTTYKFHGRGRNPFIIIGVFYPEKINQPELF